MTRETHLVSETEMLHVFANMDYRASNAPA